MWFGLFLCLGSGAAAFLSGRAMWLFEIVREGRSPSMVSCYVATFAVFLSKGVLSEPLASLLREPGDAGLANAFPWSPGYQERLPGFVDIALDAVLMTIAVAGWVLESNRQALMRLRDARTGVHVPLGRAVLMSVLRWVPVVMATAVAFSLHVALTGQNLVVAGTLLALGILSVDLAVRTGVAGAMALYLNKRKRMIDALKASLEGPPSGQSRVAPARGVARAMWPRWVLLVAAAGVAGELAVRADVESQLIAGTGPVVFMMVAGTVLEMFKSTVERRADRALDRRRNP